MRVLRWGRSAYERDEDLAAEQAATVALGGTWASAPDARTVPEARRDADVLVVTSKARVTADVLEGTPIRAVLTTTSGHDHIDLDACAAVGIAVGRCPEARRDAVVEHALGAAIALARRLPELTRTEGRWRRGELVGLGPRGIAGATVGIVGMGVIGTTAARAFEALGATVVGLDAAEGGDPGFADVLATLDVLTLHCSLTPTSRGLVDADALARLPSHAVVINTARGEVLDVPAAVDAVRAGRLGGLAVDVFAREPWPHLDAGDDPRIWFTPHAAGFTHDLGARLADEVGRSLASWAAGDGWPHPV